MKLKEMGIDFDKSLNKDEIEEIYLKSMDKDNENIKDEVIEKELETMEVISRVYLRAEPNTECDYVRILEPKELIIVHEIVDGWAKVDEGYVMASFLD